MKAALGIVDSRALRNLWEMCLLMPSVGEININQFLYKHAYTCLLALGSR